MCGTAEGVYEVSPMQLLILFFCDSGRGDWSALTLQLALSFSQPSDILDKVFPISL